jgi:hypothetical protein
MADYYPLISEAIADKKTGESRREFYDRARATLVDRLRKADPPVRHPVLIFRVVFCGISAAMPES